MCIEVHYTGSGRGVQARGHTFAINRESNQLVSRSREYVSGVKYQGHAIGHALSPFRPCTISPQNAVLDRGTEERVGRNS